MSNACSLSGENTAEAYMLCAPIVLVSLLPCYLFSVTERL